MHILITFQRDGRALTSWPCQIESEQDYRDCLNKAYEQFVIDNPGVVFEDVGLVFDQINMAPAREVVAERRNFETIIKCPTCGQSGSLAWVEGPGGGQERGGSRIFVLVSKGFHQETGRMPSGDPVIVCDNCDEIQPE
jgi:hypothetical protein